MRSGAYGESSQRYQELRFYKKALVAFMVALVVLSGVCVVNATHADAKAKTPAKVKIASVKSKQPGQLTVKVKKAKGAKTYQYVASTTKKFDKGDWYDLESVKLKKKTVVFSSLKAGKTYYVKARAWAGKKHGKWSAVKSAKVKVAASAPASKHVDTSSAELEKANAEIASLKAEKAKMQAELEAVRSDNARLRSEIESLGGDPGPAVPQTGNGTRTNPYLATDGVTLAGRNGTVAFETVNTWSDEEAIEKLVSLGAIKESNSMKNKLENKTLALFEYDVMIKSGYDNRGFDVSYLEPSYGTVLNADATANIEYDELDTYELNQSEQYKLINDSNWTVYGAGTSIKGYLAIWLPKGTSAFVVKHDMGLSNDVWVKYVF